MNTRTLAMFDRKVYAIQKHCARIMTALDEYRAQPDSIDWGYAGSAGYVEEQLAKVEAFITGAED